MITSRNQETYKHKKKKLKILLTIQSVRMNTQYGNQNRERTWRRKNELRAEAGFAGIGVDLATTTRHGGVAGGETGCVEA